ncbi:hypothetical protein [Candidatus Contubernalis alkaliaceticus]|uniref:hypothetical protein n=1 Tax=Candidatus Contubernalis alkaliaceticus TaxID=338645 RepID=UPI001F4C4C46|nr:hypothetical protein [Candidatus Contubernalis alkalaceticus]UNC91729.1 hypothetical protein HUE98_06260 [Candidatus Contubernalis alkalaceticus]
MIKISIERKALKLEKLKSRLTGATFGTKKLFKAQYTKKEYINDHSKWLDDFRKARYSSMQISGRKDAKFGNFVFKYDWQNKFLEIGLPKGKVVIESLSFPYGQELVNNVELSNLG